MTTTYRLTSGPGRRDLLLGLTDRKMLWFRGYDDQNKIHLFEIAIIKLGLLIQDPDRFAWTLDGFIFKKDGVELQEHPQCRADFDTQGRKGYFREEELVRKYSFEYFDSLSDFEIQKEIEDFRKRMPKDLEELKEYIKSLSPRQRLIVEAMHLWELHGACTGVKIGHDLSRRVQERRRKTAA